jgi:hypothetical protein
MLEFGFLQNCEDLSDPAIYEALRRVMFMHRDNVQPRIADCSKSMPTYSRAITSALFLRR